MKPELIGAIAYLVIKWIAYCGWCAVAIRWLQTQKASNWRHAIGWGTFRLGLGLVVGLFIYLGAYFIHQSLHNKELTYLVTYVPVRAVEWGFLLWLMEARDVSWRRRVIWILGGIAISCLADAAYAWMWHDALVPTGRLICQKLFFDEIA